MLLRLLMILALGAVLFGTYVRVAGSNPEVWHIDPETAESPGGTGVQIMKTQSPVWSENPEAVISAFQAVALESPRTTLLAGAASTAHLTFETRSLVWGFPDYTTVTATPVEGGTSLAVLARSRHGASDLGVNEARVSEWMAALAEALPPTQTASE